MPFRLTVAQELGSLLGTLAHQQRLIIIEELRRGERDVASLAKAIGIPQPTLSQHLNRLRLLHLVVERRESRHVYYSLRDPNLVQWLKDGFSIVEQKACLAQDVANASKKVRIVWSSAEKREHV